jgi:hypothetical protein
MNTPQGKVSVVDFLKTVKEQLGEEAWKAEIRKLSLKAFQMGGAHEQFWRDLIKDYDWINADEVKKQAEAMPHGGLDMDQVLTQALKSTMPSLKTQAQFNTFRAAFDAFRATMNAIFEGDGAKELESRKILDLSFTAAKQATDISRKLEDVPEAATSKASEEFKTPPAEFQEYDVQRKLLKELDDLKDTEALTAWYADTKAERERIRSQTLRNVLMDAIRDRKLALQKDEQAS